MLPSLNTRLARMSRCRSDLLDNEIDLDSRGHRQLCEFTRRNLDYFQLMLGYDAGLREVITLIRATQQERACAAPAARG